MESNVLEFCCNSDYECRSKQLAN